MRLLIYENGVGERCHELLRRCQQLEESRLVMTRDVRALEKTATKVYSEAFQLQRISVALVEATGQSMRFNDDPSPDLSYA